MNFVNSMPLASIEAIRPVFMIVMGVFLMVVAWRLCQATEGWTARLIVSGALMLGFGYAVILPLYDAGMIQRYSPSHGSASALGWHAIKLFVMNTGWLIFGLGLAMHAKVFSPNPPPRKLSPSPPIPPQREYTA